MTVAAAVVAGATIAGQQPALAACHAFTIAVNPASVAEGSTVNVTVTRDAGVNPSHVDVSSVNESAQAGSDYPAVQRTVSFGTETEQSFTVAVTNDTVAEPAEAFRLHLSNPGGCPINTNFQLGADARVTIPANDTAPPTTPPPPPTTAPPTTAVRPTTTTASDATTSTTATTAASTSTTSSPTSSTTAVPDTTDTTSTDEQALDETEDDGGSGGVGVAAAVVIGIVALGGLGYVLYRRRSAPTG
ncbi:MAG: Calx-beta domain-containing protein [Acidimicrobiales bacterium]